jgi:hypothetical protein
MDIEYSGAYPLPNPFPYRMHMAWANRDDPAIANFKVEYAYYDEQSGLSAIQDLTGEPDGIWGPPRVTVNDLGDVYVYLRRNATDIAVCKLNASLTACAGGWDIVSPFDATGVPIPGISDVVIGTSDGYSMAASPTTSGVVFLCYQYQEEGSEPKPKDIGCTRGVFTDSSQSWSWSPIVGVGPQNDGRDQFMPEVSVTKPTFNLFGGMSSQGVVYVSWYDRYNDPNNRTYRVRASRSLDAGLSWSSPRRLDATDSDPENLPLHCKSPNLRFIGDYAAVKASQLHTHALYITAPGPNTKTDVGASFRSLGSWYD